MPAGRRGRGALPGRRLAAQPLRCGQWAGPVRLGAGPGAAVAVGQRAGRVHGAGPPAGGGRGRQEAAAPERQPGRGGRRRLHALPLQRPGDRHPPRHADRVPGAAAVRGRCRGADDRLRGRGGGRLHRRRHLPHRGGAAHPLARMPPGLAGAGAALHRLEPTSSRRPFAFVNSRTNLAISFASRPDPSSSSDPAGPARGPCSVPAGPGLPPAPCSCPARSWPPSCAVPSSCDSGP
mmetsp:Transcript_1494/g.2061  ORF Transcript_1494/g.2061 Transcript_1494/m.2061 type:complete len:235 (-) Transcript_1494:2070-2774(-)